MTTYGGWDVNPLEWSMHTREAFREWADACFDYGQNSRAARWARGRLYDRMANDTTDTELRRSLVRRGMELLNS